MKKFKTIKYTISFDSIDVEMSTEMIISKALYDRQLKFLRAQVEEYKGSDEYRVEELNIYTKEFKSYTKSTIIFTCGCGRTILTKYECNEGYHFTK